MSSYFLSSYSFDVTKKFVLQLSCRWSPVQFQKESELLGVHISLIMIPFYFFLDFLIADFYSFGVLVHPMVLTGLAYFFFLKLDIYGIEMIGTGLVKKTELSKSGFWWRRPQFEKFFELMINRILYRLWTDSALEAYVRGKFLFFVQNCCNFDKSWENVDFYQSKR